MGSTLRPLVSCLGRTTGPRVDLSSVDVTLAAVCCSLGTFGTTGTGQHPSYSPEPVSPPPSTPSLSSLCATTGTERSRDRAGTTLLLWGRTESVVVGPGDPVDEDEFTEVVLTFRGSGLPIPPPPRSTVKAAPTPIPYVETSASETGGGSPCSRG